MVGQVDFVKLQPYHKDRSNGLANIIIEDIFQKNNVSYDFQISDLEFIWAYAKSENPTDTLGWNAFLENLKYDAIGNKSQILFLPFVDASPSNYDTIYTVLRLALEKSKSLGQAIAFATFDQPLYWKARDIVASAPENSDLKNIIVQLGGFHLLMSFLGGVGFIMVNSGLKELFCEAFARNSVNRMLQEHEYARSVRSHLLAHFVLAKIIISKIMLTNEEKEILNNIIIEIKSSENLQI